MTTIRKEILVNGEVYHVFNKSIAKYIILNNDTEYNRFLNTVKFSNLVAVPERFSQVIKKDKFTEYSNSKVLVQIVAYCLMPTHFHFVLKQVSDNGIAKFISKVANSYSKYFNCKHNRNGPLWQGRFKNVRVHTDEQLLHLSRYIHLNPVTAYLVDKPEDWKYSSYHEYINSSTENICKFSDILEIKAEVYKEFVNDNISYQRELAKINEIILE